MAAMMKRETIDPRYNAVEEAAVLVKMVAARDGNRHVHALLTGQKDRWWRRVTRGASRRIAVGSDKGPGRLVPGPCGCEVSPRRPGGRSCMPWAAAGTRSHGRRP